MAGNWELSGVSVCAEGHEKRLLLQDVSCSFKAGEITLLIGRNGAGKSTLLETMAGLRPLQAGAVELGGVSLWKRDGRRARLNAVAVLSLGISLQSSESQWFAQTVREELLYSIKPYGLQPAEAKRRMEAALTGAGLAEELLERDPWTLSGGQQRRLSLACLLACDPDWLLLDEPTAGLDADGISRLCAVLAAHRAAGRGAVVATHDLDALLPLADAVAVVDGGTVRAAAAPAAAAGHGAAAPQALRALALLRAKAALPPEAPAQGGGALWPEPRELAAALAERLTRGRAAAPAGTPAAAADAAASAKAPPSRQAQPPDGKAHSPADAGLVRPDRFDPRMLVIAYFMLAAGILLQQSLAGLAAAACLTLLLLVPFRTLIRPWLGLIRGYVLMIAVLCAVGGISFSPLIFEWDKAYPIFMRFGRLLLIMLLGMPMLKLMTPMRLQRAIEQTFGWLSRMKVPIHSFALLVTLIFRFIPLLAGEWGRFAKLAHARGKAVTTPGKVPVAMIRTILIPYVRSMLRLAEQMADALEARGFGYAPRRRTYAFRLRFGRSDGALLLTAGSGSLLLVLIANYLQ
ncbi:ATP-binding cassette domain-containing protein [Paenibacillus sp. N4]|uniref:ATP-binding cassette domain-containing protein n=1 Tax=Paenibacillus vietnamensis TaxID=2590547 RepID=UPI001CD0907F|nr:ATP-binding cassette domain-containing protein [Paenibacillus vietnamensis]MCA0754121.1 ATP-binding cassette domain-containing protein [Paenibacillus vietnamensis]